MIHFDRPGLPVHMRPAPQPSWPGPLPASAPPGAPPELAAPPLEAPATRAASAPSSPTVGLDGLASGASGRSSPLSELSTAADDPPPSSKAGTPREKPLSTASARTAMSSARPSPVPTSSPGAGPSKLAAASNIMAQPASTPTSATTPTHSQQTAGATSFMSTVFAVHTSLLKIMRALSDANLVSDPYYHELGHRGAQLGDFVLALADAPTLASVSAPLPPLHPPAPLHPTLTGTPELAQAHGRVVGGLAYLRGLLDKEVRRRAALGPSPTAHKRSSSELADMESLSARHKRQDTGEGKRAPPPGPLGLGTPTMPPSPMLGMDAMNPVNAMNPMGATNPTNGANPTGIHPAMNMNPTMSTNPMAAAPTMPHMNMSMTPAKATMGPPASPAMPRQTPPRDAPAAGVMGPPAGVPQRPMSAMGATPQQQLTTFLGQLPPVPRNALLTCARTRIMQQLPGFAGMEPGAQANYIWAWVKNVYLKLDGPKRQEQMGLMVREYQMRTQQQQAAMQGGAGAQMGAAPAQNAAPRAMPGAYGAQLTPEQRHLAAMQRQAPGHAAAGMGMGMPGGAMGMSMPGGMAPGMAGAPGGMTLNAHQQQALALAQQRQQAAGMGAFPGTLDALRSQPAPSAGGPRTSASPGFGGEGGPMLGAQAGPMMGAGMPMLGGDMFAQSPVMDAGEFGW